MTTTPTPSDAREELRDKLVAGGYRLDTNAGTNRTVDFIDTLLAEKVREAEIKKLEWVLKIDGRWNDESDVGLIQMSANAQDRAIADEIMRLAHLKGASK